ncbi:unnamed protein product [Allacma fusca]|uniref:procollagen-proline 4-dioxygenase n=1 Tax=Allacma fusca TaxID=39272 RepID=A0A8J2PA71_9HEXA|nr:unnamed protein product [Allacma fusca]
MSNPEFNLPPPFYAQSISALKSLAQEDHKIARTLTQTYLTSDEINVNDDFKNLLESHYKLIKLTEDLQPEPISSFWKKGWPQFMDLYDAIDGILRLHEMYNLDTELFASGWISGENTTFTLRSVHCYEIGIWACKTEKFVQAIKWLTLAKEMALRDKGSSLVFIEYLLLISIEIHQERARRFSNPKYELCKGTRNEIYDKLNYWDLCSGKSFQSERKKSYLFCCENCTNIARKIEHITGLHAINLSSAEALQIASYSFGGHFFPHYDEGSNVKESETRRIATFMIYLNDVEVGGVTAFTYLGLSIKPVKGSALLWHNLQFDGEPDPFTRHGACPVLLGQKWVANKWILSGDQFLKRQCRKQGQRYQIAVNKKYLPVPRDFVAHNREDEDWRRSGDQLSKQKCTVRLSDFISYGIPVPNMNFQERLKNLAISKYRPGEIVCELFLWFLPVLGLLLMLTGLFISVVKLKKIPGAGYIFFCTGGLDSNNKHPKFDKTDNNEVHISQGTVTTSCNGPLIYNYLMDVYETTGFANLKDGILNVETQAYKNPICSYRILKRVKFRLQDLVTCKLFRQIFGFIARQILYYFWQVDWPQLDDLESAIDGILKLQETYDLNTEKFAHGELSGQNRNCTFTSLDCYEMSFLAIKDGKFAVAIEWLEVARENALTDLQTSIVWIEFLLWNSIEAHNIQTEEDFVFGTNLSFCTTKIEYNSKESKSARRYANFKGTKETALEEFQYHALCSGKNFQNEKEKSMLFCWSDTRPHNDESKWRSYEGHRIATFMFYLNNVEAGGHTAFPFLGFAAKPVAGSGIFWYNLYSDGETDQLTMHGACPVLYGEKWIATKWIWIGDQFRLRKCHLEPSQRHPVPVNDKILPTISTVLNERRGANRYRTSEEELLKQKCILCMDEG